MDQRACQRGTGSCCDAQVHTKAVTRSNATKWEAGRNEKTCAVERMGIPKVDPCPRGKAAKRTTPCSFHVERGRHHRRNPHTCCKGCRAPHEPCRCRCPLSGLRGRVGGATPTNAIGLEYMFDNGDSLPTDVSTRTCTPAIPYPLPIQTRTPVVGHGFSWVRVQVGNFYPGVTRDEA